MGFFSNDEWHEVVTTRQISEDELPPHVRKIIKSVKPNERQVKNVDTFSRVQKILVEQLGVDAYEVLPNSNIVEDLGADSLDFVELIMAFEDEFKIEIPDVKAEKIKTVADIVNLLDPSYSYNNGITKINVSEEYVKSRLQKSGRKMRKVSDYL